MSTWSDAFAEVYDAADPTETPTLTFGDGITPDPTKEFDRAILKAARGVIWASDNFTYGQVVFPTVRNGHRYRVVTAGTSTSEPTWPIGNGSQITSGSVVFEEDGQDFVSIYDLRQAKYLVWNQKVKKSVPKNQVISDGRGQANTYLYLNCVKERAKYVSIGVS